MLSVPWWGLLIVVSLGVAIGWSLLRRERSRSRLQVDELQTKLAEQTRSLAHINIKLNRKNMAVRRQSNALESQKHATELAHRELQASISYAQRIQQGLLSTEEDWKNIGRQFFVMYHPRDVVGGDFHWAYANKQIACWAVGDCTGHGVPGALMSMLGVSFLNEIIADGGETEPAFVLELLRAKIIRTLNQARYADSENHDGMDIGLCIMDQRSRHLTFAGAHHPLYLVREAKRKAPEGFTRQVTLGEHTLYEFRGDRIPVGKHANDSEGFHTKSLQLWSGDSLYMMSDGLQDQLGGPDKRKYMAKRIRQKLLETQERPMAEQYRFWEAEFIDWLASSPIGQVDDVCLTGVRI